MNTMLALTQIEQVLLWGLIATFTMTTILQLSQGLGLSRISLPFIFGTVVSGNRHVANVVGFLLYLAGGVLFAFLYYLVFASIGRAGWWFGALLGLLHGLFLLTAFLPLLSYVHPRIASEYDGPIAHRRLEPPGFMGLHYGRQTPLVTLLGQMIYGTLLGLTLQLPA